MKRQKLNKLELINVFIGYFYMKTTITQHFRLYLEQTIINILALNSPKYIGNIDYLS